MVITVIFVALFPSDQQYRVTPDALKDRICSFIYRDWSQIFTGSSASSVNEHWPRTFSSQIIITIANTKIQPSKH